jgi:hypothetical protein
MHGSPLSQFTTSNRTNDIRAFCSRAECITLSVLGLQQKAKRSGAPAAFCSASRQKNVAAVSAATRGDVD